MNLEEEKIKTSQAHEVKVHSLKNLHTDLIGKIVLFD